MVRYQKRVFSIGQKNPDSDGKRIHFQRLHHNPKKLIRRSFWWLLVLLFVVLFLLLYLNGIR
ncbi:MAG: hypothetical protein JXR87_06055 [Candidatus Marinimicrobia bacterium]|nr:hypothetical protein [Candidatus Neomarinimicrobiota bacterium]